MTSTDTIIHVISKENRAPGPGAYDLPPNFGKSGKFCSISPKILSSRDVLDVPLQNVPSSIGNGPKYSLHGKPPEPKLDSTPGPAYVPPPFGTETKKISFHSRVIDKSIKDSTSPGPGAYVIAEEFGVKSKRFTMKARQFPKDGPESAAPAPTAYSPKYETTMKAVPSITIKNRIDKEKQISQVPGPGEYQVPRSLAGTAPTFHIRPSQSKTENLPGPGAYGEVASLGKDAPKFSLRSRIQAPESKVTGAPYQNLPETIGKGPKFSLRSRPKDKETQSITTGPGYVPPGLGHDAKKFSLKSRQNDKRSKSEMMPGPGEYPTPSSIGKGPKFTMKSRTFIKDEDNSGPGPTAYSPSYSTLNHSRKSEIGKRIEQKEKGSIGDYVKLPETNTGPKFTIGRRDTSLVVAGKN